jgi:hypothetical protein
MRRIWLAAVLGIVLGLGVAFTPYTSTATPQTKQRPFIVGIEETHTLAASSNHNPPTFELALLGLLVGLLVAAPFFLVARRRAQ